MRMISSLQTFPAGPGKTLLDKKFKSRGREARREKDWKIGMME
jgi:hypothetical protein